MKGLGVVALPGFPLPQKDIRDFTDRDLEKLYEEWEENDEDQLEEDELPPYKRPPKQTNFNDVLKTLFVIEDNRAIFMFSDGSQAWDAKDFLLKQPQVSEVSLEGRQFEGPAHRHSAKQEL
uniref:Mesoderm development candidate 2 n=1 Tax=Ascaris lumbricoides TaxID=6252 RepID=A0A0M3IFA5_ASCLU